MVANIAHRQLNREDKSSRSPFTREGLVPRVRSSCPFPCHPTELNLVLCYGTPLYTPLSFGGAIARLCHMILVRRCMAARESAEAFAC